MHALARGIRQTQGSEGSCHKEAVELAAPSTEQVRNIVLVGQDGAGKTSFAEAMLHLSGKTSRLGTTHDGKSNLDYDPEEIKR
ncbi:MAG: hypothetical protein LBP24_00445, partial [Coriobacteriales bacterium]|nr:hypothetical protein [Coriobacteriales bacterium]